MKELRDDRVHARMALVRELFGLAESELPPAAPVTHLDRGRRAPAARLMRIGTRASALALAQARWVAARLGSGLRAGGDHHGR